MRFFKCLKFWGGTVVGWVKLSVAESKAWMLVKERSCPAILEGRQ